MPRSAPPQGSARSIAPVLVWQLVARAPSGMLTVTLLVWGESALHSYALAGAVVAGYSVGAALGAPLNARALRSFGIVPVLVGTAMLSGSALISISLTQPPFAAAIALATFAGAMIPPITPLARTVYSQIVPPARIDAVYAVDVVAQEFIWVLGPLAAVLVAGAFGPPAAIFVCGTVIVVGAVAFSALRATRFSAGDRVRVDDTVAATGNFGERAPAATVLRLVSLVAVGLFLIGGTAIIEVLIVSMFGYHGAESGLLLGLMAFGSLVGGLTIGRLHVNDWSLARRLLLVAIGVAGTALFVDVPGLLAMALFLSGLGAAPAFAAVNVIIARSFSLRYRTEVYAASHSGQLVGMSVGAAVGGILVEQVASSAVMLTSAATVLIAALIASAAFGLKPSLSIRDEGRSSAG